MDIKVGTIRQIHRALVEDGFQIAENALRQWVRCGLIPSARSGSTAYISYDAVVSFLTQQLAIPV